MQNTMLIMLLVSVTLLKGHHSVQCPEAKKFHTEIHNNTCYLISFEKKDFNQSYEFCRSVGGYITDMEENRSSLFKDLAENNILYDKRYWIGLLWTSSLDGPVWDSGRKAGVASEMNIGQCAWYSLRAKTWKWIVCSRRENFICSFDSLEVASRNQDPCDQVCTRIKSEGLMWVPSFYPPVWDLVHLTFGLIMAASVVINIVQGVVNYRNVRKHRHLVTENLTAIAFVDKLNVDNNPMSGPYSENGDATENERILTRPHQNVYNNDGLPEMVYYDIDQAHNDKTETFSCADGRTETP